jgi:cytidylate kinase
MLITISREYGAGGAEVASRVADALGWRVVDNELVDRIAARAGLSPQDVRDREERVPGFVERLARTLVAATPELFPPPQAEGTVPKLQETDLVRITESVVAEVASEGPVVLVGRAAAAVLASARDALHVRVVAPRDYRVQAVATRLGISAVEAEKLVDETDRNRARYHRQYYQRDSRDPVGYHMVLNTAALGIEEAVRLVVAAVRREDGEDAAAQRR